MDEGERIHVGSVFIIAGIIHPEIISIISKFAICPVTIIGVTCFVLRYRKVFKATIRILYIETDFINHTEVKIEEPEGSSRVSREARTDSSKEAEKAADDIVEDLKL